MDSDGSLHTVVPLHVKPTKENPTLFVFDGHNPHTRNLDVTDMGRQHHAAVLCLPPHSTCFTFLDNYYSYFKYGVGY